MSDINDGGPAFPPNIAICPAGDVHETHGMSLRDWFAGQALPVLLTRWMESAEIKQHPSIAAYEVADAMLAERAKAVSP